jgi:hypothetical protein
MSVRATWSRVSAASPQNAATHTVPSGPFFDSRALEWDISAGFEQRAPPPLLLPPRQCKRPPRPAQRPPRVEEDSAVRVRGVAAGCAVFGWFWESLTRAEEGRGQRVASRGRRGEGENRSETARGRAEVT